MSTDIDINTYKCSDKGLILPIINEYTWAIWVRATLYIICMIWCFIGIAIVADVFMVAIEKITSKTRKIKISNPKQKDGIEEIEVKVWNDTVANLSLMAFGTSAPEILLNVVEVCGKGFTSGQLGPATIVGSAAFNLLVISAVCIVSIPVGSVRIISNLRVYAVTTMFSMFSYIWMYLVLRVFTPNEVLLWEAIVTFLLFPTLILVSFLVDKMCYCVKPNKTSSEVEIGIETAESGGEPTRDENVDIIHLAKEFGKHHIPEEEAAKMVALKLSENQSHNKGWYRIQATRKLTGGQRLVPKVKETFQELYDHVLLKSPSSSPLKDVRVGTIDLSENGSKAVVEFTSAASAVLENEGTVRLGIRRYGKVNIPISVRIETIDGTAEATSDYIPVNKTLNFAANETLKDLHVKIVDDDVWEPDEFFFAKLFVDQESENLPHILIGNTSINQITIINDDEPGQFGFTKPSYIVSEGSGKAQVQVTRVNGADGTVHLNWKTRDMSAHSGKDYVSGEGTLEFSHGEMQKAIDITILSTDDSEDKDCNFMVELLTPDGGATLGKISKTIVTIVNDDEFNSIVSRIAAQTRQNLDFLKLDTSSWAEQFYTAMNVNGGEVDDATAIDYVLHFLSFFWKVLFACIPPPSIGGGWLTFIFSLLMIGMMTVIVGDLATIFGCLLGMSDLITAITIVALGTSMPDTFASRQAAINEKYADSSIGNVNGSNAVNVFLGMGLPWLIGCIYWEIQGEVFHAPADNLGFSVVLYLSCSAIAVALMMCRRKFTGFFGGAELGGKVCGKWFSGVFLVILWLLYVILSSLQSMDVFSATF